MVTGAIGCAEASGPAFSIANVLRSLKMAMPMPTSTMTNAPQDMNLWDTTVDFNAIKSA